MGQKNQKRVHQGSQPESFLGATGGKGLFLTECGQWPPRDGHHHNTLRGTGQEECDHAGSGQ